jgi:hypothetical protein
MQIQVATAQRLFIPPNTLSVINKTSKQQLDLCMPYSQHINDNATIPSHIPGQFLTESCHGVLAALTNECSPDRQGIMVGQSICSDPNLIDWEQRYYNPSTDQFMVSFPSVINKNATNANTTSTLSNNTTAAAPVPGISGTG